MMGNMGSSGSHWRTFAQVGSLLKEGTSNRGLEEKWDVARWEWPARGRRCRKYSTQRKQEVTE